MALIDYIPFLIPMVLFALIGAFSLFWYTRTRKTGFVWIGIGFIVQIFPNLISLALGGPFLALRLYERGLNVSEIGRFLFLLYLVETAISIAFIVLVLVGLASLAKEDKK